MSEIKERPILFSGEMVKAILEGRKSQTRRAMNPQPTNCGLLYVDGKQISDGDFYVWAGRKYITEGWEGEKGRAVSDSPYGRKGNRLWVRETFAIVPRTAYRMSEGVQQTDNPNDPFQHDAAVYRAGWTRSKPGVWKPSIHMPRWASRILLEITDVRVERVQGISEKDALAEGCTPSIDNGWLLPIRQFPTLWDSINAKRGYSWESNPWVWVVEFKQVQP